MMPSESSVEFTAAFADTIVEDDAPHAETVRYVLPSTIRDKAAFFEAVRATLPLDPPVHGDTSWDALSDSLWEGLHTRGARDVRILWPGAEAMAICARADYELAIRVVTDVIRSLGDASATSGSPTRVVFVVQGPPI